MKRIVPALVLGLVVTACHGSSSSALPTGPSAAPPVSAAPPAPPPSLTLTGFVIDTAYRMLEGVRVEVMQGPDTGRVMTSDAQGRFTYTGTFTTPVTLRATKDGYVGASATAQVLTTGGAWASFRLAPNEPPVPVAGDYVLTITADPACTGLPEDVRTRTYGASVTPNTRAPVPANTTFEGSVSGGRFVSYANMFWVGVAGSYVVVTTEGEGPSIVEEVTPNRFIAYGGSVGVTVGPSGSTTITGAFRGVIEYCELKAPMGLYYDCRPELANVREQCTSGGVLTLSRR